MITKIKEFGRRFAKRHDVRDKFFRAFDRPEKILELGCGSGENCCDLKEIYPSAEIYAVDKNNNDKIPGFVLFKQTDLDLGELPYQDSFFDGIIFTHVIEHLKDPFSLGNEINRVLKEGGRVYIETPNWTTMFVPSFGFKRDQHGPFNFFDDPTHIKPWSKHSLFAYLSQTCKLHVERVGTVRNWIRIPHVFGIITGKRKDFITGFQNFYGWNIYGIGVKTK